MSNFPLDTIKKSSQIILFFAVALKQILYLGKKIHGLVESAILQIMLACLFSF